MKGPNILLNNLKDKEMLLGGINVSKQGKVFDGSTEVASCLLARDYKGLGNQSMTAVAEPAILTPKRTEYGKSIRKDYESGKIQESRHNMTELQPREDGISNT